MEIPENFSEMEIPNNSLQSFIAGFNKKLEEKKKRLLLLEEIRDSAYLYVYKGKKRGRDCWHEILVDCDKKEKYLQDDRNGPIHIKYYGKILASGWGHEAPEETNNKTYKFIEDLRKRLFIFKLQANHEIYYVLCDADKRNKIAASRTAEEVGQCGRILYSAMDEDPPEALWDVIERSYFGSSTWTGRFDFHNRGIEAARSGNLKKVKSFLEEVGNADWTDEDGWTMLHHAAHCGDLDMITALKDMNANTQVRDNICGRKPIHIAARECYPKSIKLFLINDASVDDVDKSGWTPLHYAAWKGESKTVEYLISKNANTETMDRCWGKKPIHVAVAEGHIHIVQIFLGNQANIDDADAQGRTLLYHSALAGRFEMAKFLINEGANVNLANKSDVKPIHISAEHDGSQVAELLLEHGADIESQDCRGDTSLHRAVSCGGIKVVKMLVEKGANLIAVNNQGETPFEKTVANQYLNKASYLAEKMCEQFREKASYSAVLEVYVKLFKLQKEILDRDHYKTLNTQTNIVWTLYDLGIYEEASKICSDINDAVALQDMAKRKVRLGANHPDSLSDGYHNLVQKRLVTVKKRSENITGRGRCCLQ